MPGAAPTGRPPPPLCLQIGRLHPGPLELHLDPCPSSVACFASAPSLAPHASAAERERRCHHHSADLTVSLCTAPGCCSAPASRSPPHRIAALLSTVAVLSAPLLAVVDLWILPQQGPSDAAVMSMHKEAVGSAGSAVGWQFAQPLSLLFDPKSSPILHLPVKMCSQASIFWDEHEVQLSLLGFYIEDVVIHTWEVQLPASVEGKVQNKKTDCST